jgi:hypothetical protein
MTEDVLEVAVAELRPSLEALLMIADQPLDETTLATAVGAPVAEFRIDEFEGAPEPEEPAPAADESAAPPDPMTPETEETP